jgi:receptor protein-tyrosine kinase
MTSLPDSHTHLVERLQRARRAEAHPHLAERTVEALHGAEPVGPMTANRRDAPPPPPPAVAPITLAALMKAGLVASQDRATRIRVLEEIAIAQTQLMRGMPKRNAQDGRPADVVVFTSARPGEGKTFCSINIAAGLARSSGRSVLLVDADGKHGSMSMAIDQQAAPGFMAYATDPTMPVAKVVMPTEIPRLALLPYGAPNAREGQPAGPRLAGALQRLAAAMPQHIIIVDTPPCLATSDPSTLAPVAGQVVVVVKAESTERREVEAALDMVDACPTLHLLLNQVQLTVSDSFGAYGGYDGYGGSGGDA